MKSKYKSNHKPKDIKLPKRSRVHPKSKRDLDYFYASQVAPINSLSIYRNGDEFDLSSTISERQRAISRLELIPKGIKLQIHPQTGQVTVSYENRPYNP
ncbi:MAG: hypothetical protein AABX11_04125 [Nanoarchaeota archaeon]